MSLLVALLLAQPTQAEIESAVRKGLEVVKNGQGELALWTLVAARVPPGQARLEAALKEPPSNTTSAALQAMALDGLDRRKYTVRTAHCAQQLIDTQCRDGLWNDGKGVEAPEIPLPRIEKPHPLLLFDEPRNPPVTWTHKLLRRAEGGEKGDLTRTRWALWGLLAGRRSGLIPPAEVVEKAAAAVRSGGGDAAEIVTCLCVCAHLMGKDYRRDPDIRKAVERLAAERRTEPEPLYVLERAMIHSDRDTLGGVAWYPRDAKILLAAQKLDGSWGTLEDTCYATLTLHKAYARIDDPARRK
jgi:hypothetical protein